jgi:CheY-like chemotaxis protein
VLERTLRLGFARPRVSGFSMSGRIYKAAKPVILLVEDYRDAREMLGLLLQGWGWQVLESANGVEAFELARIHRPILIITDLNLPGIDGIELVRQIRHAGNWFEIVPIIMLTAIDEETSRHTALAAGVNRFFTKPLNVTLLESSISELVEDSILQEEYRNNKNSVK